MTQLDNLGDHVDGTLIAESQSQKATTSNAVDNLLSNATQKILSKTITGNTTLTDDEFFGSFFIDLEGTPAADFSLFLPNSGSHTFSVRNGTGKIATIDSGISGGTVVVVPDGVTRLIHADGTDTVDLVAGSFDLNGGELILDADGDSSFTADTDDRLDLKLNGADLFRWDGTVASPVNGFDFVAAAAGNEPSITAFVTDTDMSILLTPKGTGVLATAAKTMIGSISVVPDGTLHVHSGSAGAVTASASADDLVVENSTVGGISILVPDASNSAVFFGSLGRDRGARVQWNHDVALMTIGTSLSGGAIAFMTAIEIEAMRLDANGALFIGDTANANMTVGLTINQGANDDEVLALKSSDVGHAMTGSAEADTFGSFAKVEGTSGGLRIRGYKDADGAGGFAIRMEGFLGEAAETGDISTSNAVIHINGAVTDGSTDVTGVADTGNLFVLENNGVVRALVKGNGTLHITNVIDIAATTGTDVSVAIALDAEDDVALVRCHQRTVYHDAGIAMTKWDASLKANEDDLKRLGVLSSQGDFTIVHRMHSLLGGAIWQSHVARSELEQAIAETMPAIAARLEEIRAERRLAQLN